MKDRASDNWRVQTARWRDWSACVRAEMNWPGGRVLGWEKDGGGVQSWIAAQRVCRDEGIDMETGEVGELGCSAAEKRRRGIVFGASMAVMVASTLAYYMGLKGYPLDTWPSALITGLAMFLPSLAFPKIPKWQIGALWLAVAVMGEVSVRLSEATGSPLWWAAGVVVADLMCASGAGVYWVRKGYLEREPEAGSPRGEG